MDSPLKEHRQKTLSRIIDSHEFTSQADVVSQMVKAGFDATQSSISRDFRELGIGKIGGVYRTASALRGTFQSPIKLLIQSAEPAGENLLVVKTSPGGASAVAEAIDIEDVPGVVGTVAGDNTIFIATTTGVVQKKILRKLDSL